MTPTDPVGSVHDPRAWTLPELRKAFALAYGTTRSGAPQVQPVADRLGVTPRSVQRWLAGTSAPRPDRLEQLRQAILPDPLVLGQQEDLRLWAENAARAMGARRPRLDPQWIAQGWHTPHRLLVLADPAMGIRRPAIEIVARSTSNRSYGSSWLVTDELPLPHRPAALLVRHALLDSVAAWRVRVHRSFTDGHTLCWLNDAPTPPLKDLAHQAGWEPTPSVRSRYEA